MFANLPRFNLVTSGAVTLLDNPWGRLLRRDAAGKLLPELVELGAMQAFVRKYGVLRRSAEDEETTAFVVDAADFTDAQDVLRKAWAGDSGSIAEIEVQVKYALEAQPSVKAGGIELTTENLWSFICILFLLDRKAGKTGVCANPECPAPYFVRRRKDQKYCERGSCSAYAQRQYALGWWERKGYEIRAKKSKARQAKRRTRT